PAAICSAPTGTPAANSASRTRRRDAVRRRPWSRTTLNALDRSGTSATRLLAGGMVMTRSCCHRPLGQAFTALTTGPLAQIISSARTQARAGVARVAVARPRDGGEVPELAQRHRSHSRLGASLVQRPRPTAPARRAGDRYKEQTDPT